MIEYASVAVEIVIGLAGVVGAWAVMRNQVSDLRYSSRAHSADIESLKLDYARLDERNSGFSQKLDGALGKLEHVTGQLQAIAIEMARNSGRD